MLFVDCENNDTHLMTRIMSAEPVVGAAYLLGNIYVITQKSPNVLVYTGHSQYDLDNTIPVAGMIAVDIATSYVDVCVYVLDDGNGRVSRIDRNRNVTTFIDGLGRGNLLSMSVNSEGRLTIVQKNSRILTYDKGGNVVGDRIAPDEDILHAVEDGKQGFIVCDGKRIFKMTNDRKEVCRQDEVGCRYVDVNRDGDLIACDSSGHQIVKLNPETLQVIATLLTLDRDGVESPRHVRYVMENGLMLVSWMHFLDVYSFRRSATQGYLASPEDDIREQRSREANELESEITQSSVFLQLIQMSDEFALLCPPCVGKNHSLRSNSKIAYSFYTGIGPTKCHFSCLAVLL